MRAKKLNEKYYGRDNQRSFPQLKAKGYDFRDEFGRLYYVREDNDDTFQNDNLRETKGKGRCIYESNGSITLDVKLRKGAEWFGDGQIGKKFFLFPRTTSGGYASGYYIVRLETAMKVGVRRRVGTVQILGLDRDLCNFIIQKNIQRKEHQHV